MTDDLWDDEPPPPIPTDWAWLPEAWLSTLKAGASRPDAPVPARAPPGGDPRRPREALLFRLVLFPPPQGRRSVSPGAPCGQIWMSPGSRKPSSPINLRRDAGRGRDGVHLGEEDGRHPPRDQPGGGRAGRASISRLSGPERRAVLARLAAGVRAIQQVRAEARPSSPTMRRRCASAWSWAAAPCLKAPPPAPRTSLMAAATITPDANTVPGTQDV